MSDIERAFWFGQRAIENPTSAEPTRYTGGLMNSISTVVDVSTDTADAGVMTEEEFDKVLIDTIFAYGSKEKIAFFGADVAHHLNWFGKDRWRPSQVDDAYGMKFTRYTTLAGDILGYLHPMFRQVPGMKSTMVLIDTSDLTYRYMEGRDTALLRDRQGNGEDRKKHEFLTECGLELRQDRTHAIITGWQKRAA